MAKKTMAASVKRSAKTGAFVAARNQQRLTDSITGSLRVEGYDVKRETVAALVRDRCTARLKK